MRTLYVSQQGCYVSLNGEILLVKQGDTIHAQVQLPLTEQILIFGKSQVTTQAIRACLWRDIPIAYLSRMGYCYGRLMSIEWGYRQLAHYQQQLVFGERLKTARAIVTAKLKNSRILLRRQRRRNESERLEKVLKSLDYLATQASQADSLERLMGFEGAGAAQYFEVFGECLSNSEFVFTQRTRRPPGNPVNAMLSFGYQILWNHLLALIELQGLDPYQASLHQGTERHAALASDLIEEFRSPLVDSLVLWLVNKNAIDARKDFVYNNGGCYLNESGRKKFLKLFVQRMEEVIQSNSGDKQPRWDILNQQVKAYKQFVYNPSQGYQPYQIR
ncbi:CRISPR-associated endonuclease Cas1 [Coleofasciculus sp.]|uniref:CRISPR-associated endonuclease Cas1 n=1 Tax=Coleofasciculus sp. TaxID=3100458 RepID=UPI003A41824D